ncbi:hypothetical protein [Gymnodinialimonas ceratoperidinii]|uniref:Uncharacterized protein n=1 Tax=Gymnodinialimonas ceratoperidinii TaxID=2856823 RepID=A0A8F6TTN2_9RHOB|nr:hypothetical protein [Gymnodinialimonas ceratoperidinii]QXT38742.1 hypothetical protein KYE46_12460 [Gymnodinialimonas ceratoperidinii]
MSARVREFFRRWIIQAVSDQFYSFGTAISWSALSSIGNSRIARLTIIMPFVGYLIVFNSTLSDYFSTILPADLAHESGDLWTFLYSRNLYFLYFGLLLFGGGVALFNVVAPSQIRRFPAAESYIAAMDTIRTPNLVIGSFENTIGMYFASLHGEERSSMFVARRIGFPSDVSGDLHRFVERLFLATEFSDEDFEPAEDRLGSRFWTGSGYLMTDEVLDVAYSGRRADRILHVALLDEAVAHPTDVFYLEHRALEYHRSAARIIVFLFYAMGSALLVFPSILTSILILKFW